MTLQIVRYLTVNLVVNQTHLLLDLGNCLIPTDDEPTFRWLVDRHRINPDRAKRFFEGNSWYLEFCRGRLHEAKYHQYLVEMLQPDISPDDRLSMNDTKVAYLQSILPCDSHVLALAEELGKKMNIVIVTDTNLWQSEFFRTSIDFDALAARVFESHLVGMIKKDPDYWPHVLGVLGIEGPQAVLIDDNRTNRRMAEGSGIYAPVCQPNPGETGVKELRDQLTDLL